MNMKSDYKTWISINFMFFSLYMMICFVIYFNIHYKITLLFMWFNIIYYEWFHWKKPNSARLRTLKIAHNNMYSLLPKVDIIATELSN